MKIVRFSALFFTALALAPALAHLFELPNKIDLSREEYLIVQQIYSGWALLGFVVFGALVSNLMLTILLRKNSRAFVLSLIAFLCILGTQALFWTFTFPANQATNNWTFLPDNWQALRYQWEYSHASSAVLNLTAMITLILAILSEPDRSEIRNSPTQRTREHHVDERMAPACRTPGTQGSRATITSLRTRPYGA